MFTRLGSKSKSAAACKSTVGPTQYSLIKTTLVDGEQRTEICKQHEEFFATVLRFSVTDVDRRMLRQILNKLRGKHNKELDDAEYIRIIEQVRKTA